MEKANNFRAMTTVAVAALLAATLLAGPARAATLTVNSTNDPGDGTCDAAECTLR